CDTHLARSVGLQSTITSRLNSLVCTHGVEVGQPLPRVRRNALQKAVLVLAPSRYTAEHVAADQGVDSGKVRVLPWALDPQFESLAVHAAKNALPARFPQGQGVLTVGRWSAAERYRGMDTHITARPRLRPPA